MLIFDWRPVRWRKTRLMVALAVAAAGHLLVFYLFQVVTESSSRQAPPVREVTILSGVDDSSLRLLEAVEDRLPALNAPAPLEDGGAGALALLVKGYVPTWQDHRPALKPLPGQQGTGALPPLMAGSAGMLPPLPASLVGASVKAPRAPGPAVRPEPVLAFQSGLMDRALLSTPVWPAVVTSQDWPEEGPASFMLGIDPSGNVTSCLSLGTSPGLDEEEVEKLRGVMLKLRFTPAATSDQVVWAWVDVLW